MESRKWNVGLVGAGFIATYHVAAIRAVPGANVTAICDTERRRAEALARRHGITNAYGSVAEMLAAAELDVVHVLTPPDEHYGAARAALEAGAHVVLEKPMCTTKQQCEELLDLGSRLNLHVGVSHNFLFYTVYEQLRADVRAGRLGRLDQVTITWNFELGQLTTGPFEHWMLQNPRNIMLEIGSHAVAIMLDLAGAPDEIIVRAANPVRLPGGMRFYRRWHVLAECGPTAVELRFSFIPAFPERAIHARGTLGSATADMEHNTYVRQRRTPHGADLDRYHQILAVSNDLRRQARRNLAALLRCKLHVASQGEPYPDSIARAVRCFYESMGGSLDERCAGHCGRDVIRECIRIGRAARVDSQGSPIVHATRGAVLARPEVLVLGGTGFIGRELVRQLLAAGRTVRLMTRHPGNVCLNGQPTPHEVLAGDLLSDTDMQRAIAGVRYVFHLARPFVKTWPEYYEEEVQVTQRVAECCLREGIQRLIYTGTIASYYTGARAGVITERTPLDKRIERRDPYSRAKAMSEQVLQGLHKAHGLPVVIFRPGIVIGAGGSPLHWGVGMWNGPGVCQLWGDGRNTLPIVLVDDVAQALIAGMDIPAIDGEIFNLVGEPLLSAQEYLDELERRGGISVQRFPTPIWRYYAADMSKWILKVLARYPGRQRPSYRDWESRSARATFDCTKARRLLGWNPQTDRACIIARGIHVPVNEIIA